MNVAKEYRGRGIAAQQLVRMGEWFVEQRLRRICVNVEPR